MNKLNALIIVAVIFTVGIGCSSIMKGKELADPAVAKFHEQFNAGQYTEIYNGADDEFKRSVTPQEWDELMNAIHRKLGTIANSTSSAWNVNTTPLGTMATISCNVDFTEGKASEQFVFAISGDNAKLYNYNVNSPLLITR